MSVNARGIFLGCRGVLPYMLRANYGRIVNIASVAGKEGNAGMLAYSASKGAVSAACGAMGRTGAIDGAGRGTSHPPPPRRVGAGDRADQGKSRSPGGRGGGGWPMARHAAPAAPLPRR
jgi:NAD(P)-dependent dehydrogenase (short-subunit alcohol dehydrogenase family)